MFLFLRRLGLDREDGMVDVANREEVEGVLAEVAAQFSRAG
ncbi:hypothetical protein [Falsiroseomonas oryzae]|nr:hypothetical protein [Roseomonas sp. MO-31]